MTARVKTWVPGCGDPDCGCTLWGTAKASVADAMMVAVKAIADGGRVKRRVRRDGVTVITVTDPARRGIPGGTPAAIFFF